MLQDKSVEIGGDGPQNAVEIKYKSPSTYGNWIGLLISFLPLILCSAPSSSS